MHIKDVLIQFEVNYHVEECLLIAPSSKERKSTNHLPTHLWTLLKHFADKEAKRKKGVQNKIDYHFTN